jgi:predicted  nucleic acid-binding Zn-ribbon protein
VESVLDDLIAMVRLQRIYDQVSTALNEWKTPPSEVQKLHDENRQRQVELEELEAQVGKLEGECEEVRKKEREWHLELEHFQKQKVAVTNEREFTAVISEIDYATKAIDESSTRRKDLEAQIATLTGDIAARRQARPEEEAAQHDVVEAWEGRRKVLKDAIHELAGQAAALEEQLAPQNKSRFRRLLESKRGTAVAEVVEGSCSLCHFALRPHLQQRVRRVQEIIACEHCHRILYFADSIG